MSIRALCHWCAAEKSRAFVQCRICGEMPSEVDRIMAWLLSDAYLTDDDLVETQKRLRMGHVLAPTEHARRIAQRALGLHVETDNYNWPQLIGISCLAILFSSIFPLGLWWTKSSHRPLKAKQLLCIALIAGIIDLAVVFYSLSL